VCRCEPENHVLELVRTHARSGTPRPLVVVANTDRDTPYCEQVLAWRSDRVRFLGPIYEPRVLSALRVHGHTYLHGHGVGGTNPSLLEAMGCGAFVIAFDNAFNREVLGPAGLYFQGEESLRAALEAASGTSSGEREALGRAARERVERHYTWEAVAQDYAALLGEVAERWQVESARGAA